MKSLFCKAWPGHLQKTAFPGRLGIEPSCSPLDCPNGLQIRTPPSLPVSSGTKVSHFIGLLGDANPFLCRPETAGRKEFVCNPFAKIWRDLCPPI